VNPQQSKYASIGPVEVSGRDKVVYTVKQNDNLGLISAWFRVRTSDVKYWNKLRNNSIKVGQKLAIYVPEGQGVYYANIVKLSYSEKQKSLNQKPSTSHSEKLASTSKTGNKELSSKSTVKNVQITEKAGSPSDSSVSQLSASEDVVYYTVRKGDNFWTIAKKFPGISNQEIMKINNIKEASSLKVGQVLKIMTKA